MKALIYKEFKLAMHPACILLIVLFPFMILIPNYPLAIGMIYVLAGYPILFLGANKGQQSHDLLYSVLQPIRKKDIVLARIITVCSMQLATILLMSALYPLARVVNTQIINQAIASGQQIPIFPGLGLDAFISILAFGIICYSIADLVYLPIYYHKGRSIVASTILSIVAFCILISGFTVLLPMGIPGFNDFFSKSELWVQLLFLLGSVIFSILIHYVTYLISSKELDKVDF